MLNLALWLKKNGFRADQVQAFYPSPMASATTMYYSEKNPLHQVTYKSEKVQTAKSPEQRKLHKAFLRWHDPKNWCTRRTGGRTRVGSIRSGWGRWPLAKLQTSSSQARRC